ncbi:Na+/H+ antiporter subunit E [bacterium]|nr:Na+/H+ antiporter subunit E [bacterium]MBU1064475.1 Na+/H+ antiporter subunit E [bacterium]MBU1633292.1 Na+/H+ antiporter subunit E [bacterium]MBU1874724.1 Na+/H+ antiporter subunit E [bacterium]
MKIFKQGILLLLFLLLFWVLLTSIDSQELIAGGVIVILLTLVFSRKAAVFGDFQITFKSLIYSIAYIFVFLAALVRSNLDVAFRVLSPKLPINPGIVKVKTSLNSKTGRLVLANSITLTPGTLTVETKGDHFYIHWIDVSTQDVDLASQEIVSKFEKYLEVMFG